MRRWRSDREVSLPTSGKTLWRLANTCITLRSGAILAIPEKCDQTKTSKHEYLCSHVRFTTVAWFGTTLRRVFNFVHFVARAALTILLPSTSLPPSCSFEVMCSSPGQRLRISWAAGGKIIVRTLGNVLPAKAFLRGVVSWEWTWQIWMVWRLGRAARQFANSGSMVSIWYLVNETVTMLADMCQ